MKLALAFLILQGILLCLEWYLIGAYYLNLP